MTVPTVPGGALVQDTRLATSFTLDGFQLLTPAWFANVKPLIESPPGRGQNVLKPLTAGLIAYPNLATERTLTLDIPMVGFVNSSGVLAGDPWAQFVTNLYTLRANLDPIGTGDGARAAVLTLAGGVTKSGRLQPNGITIKEQVGPACVFTFAFKLPSGALS